jgi:hypothetical protein
MQAAVKDSLHGSGKRAERTTWLMSNDVGEENVVAWVAAEIWRRISESVLRPSPTVISGPAWPGPRTSG